MKDVNELKKIKSTPFSRWLLGDIDAQIKQREEKLKDIEHNLTYANSVAMLTRENQQLYSKVLLQRIVIAVLVVLLITFVTLIIKNTLK